ncbi:hypothetical protein KP509_24G079700 [Ceratopteris richardii]|uniref:Polyprotein n=1 Tax=Ceratopteris richardii TaxID=49495 RepID=A0A8T2RWR9_CERRI|nr:hypothetical protein KP509_24G079700 [Ceratopteris richardii]
MRIERQKQQHTLCLSQEKYIEEVLDRFNMTDAKPPRVPLQLHVKISKDNCPKSDAAANHMKDVPYKSVCDSLMYAMVANRPNIAHAKGVVYQFMANLGKAHWNAVKSILRYLKGTQGKCVCYGKSPLELKGFCDFDMVGDVNRRNSKSGYVYTLARCDISWCSTI